MTINTIHLALCACLTILPAALSLGAPVPFVCPTSLTPASLSINGVDGDWVPYIKAPMYLSAATAIYGPPEMRGDLVPDGERRGKGTVTVTYDLEGTFAEGKWLQCGYGEHSQLTLSRRLPDTITACTFTYRKGEKVGQNDITIVCR